MRVHPATGSGRARRGFALVTALSILALMSMLAYAFRGTMELNARVATAERWSTEARYLAAAGVAEAQALLAAGHNPAPLATSHALGTGNVSVIVEDVYAKLHLNAAPADEVARVLGIRDPGRIEAARPVGSVHGAYAALGLLPEQYADVRALTTVHGDGGIDLDQAPEAVLAALTGLSRSQAQAIIRYRVGPDGRAGTADDRSVNAVAALSAVPGVDAATATALGPRLRRGGLWYRVVSEGRVVSGGRTRRVARVEAVLRRGPAGMEPVVWIEGASGT